MTSLDIEVRRKQFEDGLEMEITDRLERTRDDREEELGEIIEQQLRDEFESKLEELIQDELEKTRDKREQKLAGTAVRNRNANRNHRVPVTIGPSTIANVSGTGGVK